MTPNNIYSGSTSKNKRHVSDSKGMKWHAAVIRWCISIYLKLQGVHEQFKNSRFLKLSHKKTLPIYANYA